LGGYITDNFDWRWIFFINVPVAIVSLFLTNRIVEDPPHIVKEVKAMQKKGLNLDFTGFGLLAIGFGSLEFVLDKGQEDDWFGSHLITTFAILCITSLTTLILWEMRQIRIGHKPILDLTLFKNRNFAISFILMFVLGFCLFGSTVLIPQFVQSMLGYTAERAGMVISPGAAGILILMPLVGFLVAKVDARFLVAYGFTSCSVALFTMMNLNLDVSYSYVLWLRVFQASGLAFLFVPISTISFAAVPPGKNNDASGLTNLARNIGGSVGTAFLVTVLARRAQYHQARLGDRLSPGNTAMLNEAGTMSRYLHDKGGLAYSLMQGRAMAEGSVMRQLILHSTMLAYIDVIKCFAIAMALMVPIVFFMTKVKGGRGMGGH
jgi:DHA2 family multidrug resistance protein